MPANGDFNYNHLRSFWMVSHEGSVTRTAEKLRLSQPAISMQLRELERSLGAKLLERSGRSLALTEAGRHVQRYADQIFDLSRELTDSLEGRESRFARFTVGVAMVVPKLLAYRFVRPALTLPAPVQIQCVEDRPERLLTELAAQTIDLALADTPLTPPAKIRAFNHLLGETPVAIFGAPDVAAAHRARFPRSLHGAPLLLPTEISSLRRSLDDWFEEEGIRPRIVGEFDDTALLGVFGQQAVGLFPAPAVIQDEIRRQHGVEHIGTLHTVRQRFYAISGERRLTHPAVRALAEAARSELFG